MQEYLALDHMLLIKSHSLYIITYHFAKKISSSTRKLKIIFNILDRDSSGLSLKYRFLSEFNTQKDIVDALSLSVSL